MRGEEHLPLNPVLRFVAAQGCRIVYENRSNYRKKHTIDYLNILQKEFGESWIVPEGGSNNLAIKGVIEWAKKLPSGFDYMLSPIGTGGTIAALIAGLPHAESSIIGIPFFFTIIQHTCFFNQGI